MAGTVGYSTWRVVDVASSQCGEQSTRCVVVGFAMWSVPNDV